MRVRTASWIKQPRVKRATSHVSSTSAREAPAPKSPTYMGLRTNLYGPCETKTEARRVITVSVRLRPRLKNIQISQPAEEANPNEPAHWDRVGTAGGHSREAR
jgi:hypothetical protein